MPRLPVLSGRHRRRALLALVAVIAVAALGTLGATFLGSDNAAAAVSTHEDVVEVPKAPGAPDRERLDITLYLPEGAQDSPAPAVLLPHGFGGSKHSVSRDAQELAERGFVVLTYSARGFGKSTGSISLNDPDAEVADASYLVDYLAAQQTVALDAEGDPKVAVTGASYAGALALLLAGTDERIDAIAPVMTYNDLGQALVPNNASTKKFTADSAAASVASPEGVFKQAWAGVLFSGGLGTPSGAGGQGAPMDAPEPGADPNDADAGAGADGGGIGGPGQQGAANGGPRPDAGARPSDAGPCGRFTEQVCAAYQDLATDGLANDRTIQLLERVSPKAVTDEISVPTLLVQGERDTLFGLDHADANARQISEAGGDVQLVWYAGGHDGGGPGPQLRGKLADWLSFQLGGTDAPADNPLPAFSYDVQGSFRASRAPSVRIVESDSYPGLDGGAAVSSTSMELAGPEQAVINPPGGTPAAISGVPGLNGLAGRSSALASMFGIDLPGQAAAFTSRELDSQLLATGSPTVRLRVTALPWAGGGRPREADGVLFVKLYDVGPDGSRTLPGNAIAPVRIPGLRVGEAAEVTVSLPGIVRPVDAGHRLQVVVATTDQAYANSITPAAYRISLPDSAVLTVPEVPGTSANTGWPVGQLAGIAGVLLFAAAVGTVAAIRRRRAHSVDETLADVPLVISNLTKSYPGGVTAVSDLSFRVERGQVLGLLGPNGAGKTTTLRMLMGLITPTSGEIRVFGHKVRPGAPVLSRIGSFVEGSGFLPHLSGDANLRLYWAATGRPAERAHFTEALEIAGLGDAVHRKVRTYSQGMRQRLAIAQAMLGLPELLVLDEPTNGLDPPQIHQMREVLRRYAATGRTVLVSSHLLAEVEQTATHVVVMHRGALVADGEVGEIVAAGGEASFVVDKPEEAAEALRAVPGVADVEVDGTKVHADLDGLPRSAAIAALVRADIAVEQAGARRRLEDAFLQLVGEDGADEPRS
ncbi:MAG: alpha/beta fold hydrolase [Actinophytocola sp.]|nr:alpha/beta fold hydrolase [Actinophytocola sp.]